jgi:hypothetical protein
MGLVKETTIPYEEVLRPSANCQDLKSGQLPSEWAREVMRKARREARK